MTDELRAAIIKGAKEAQKVDMTDPEYIKQHKEKQMRVSAESRAFCNSYFKKLERGARETEERIKNRRFKG